MTNPLDKMNRISNHPLFQSLSEKTFQEYMESCSFLTYEENDVILAKEKKRDGLHLLLEGMAEIYVNSEKLADEEVLEVIKIGELIGLSSIKEFLGNVEDQDKPFVEVRALEQCVCLYLPYSVLEKMWAYEPVKDYILRQVAIRLKDIYDSLIEQVSIQRQWGASMPFIHRVQDMMNASVVTALTTERLKEVAGKMKDSRVSSALVLTDNRIEGIVTERDIVHSAVAKNLSGETEIEFLMTKNPVTIASDAYYYEALTTCLTHGIKHLPVVNGGELVGIVTLSDLMRKSNYRYFDLIAQIEETAKARIADASIAITTVLAKLLDDKVPVVHTLEVVTKLYDRLLKRAVELSIQSLREKGLGEPPCDFCWYLMGSGGRGELFMPTDQDHFLVYEKDSKKNGDYFSQLGIEIVLILEKAGFRRCEGKMMASENNWNGAFSEWQQRVHRWQIRSTNDAMLLAQSFFSQRFLFGSRQLHEQFTKMIKQSMKQGSILLYRMAQLERDRPIPNLGTPVRSLLGVERKQLDMKKEVLFPFHHAIQLSALKYGIVEGTPLEKVAQLVEKNVFTRQFERDIQDAFYDCMNVYVMKKWESRLKRDSFLKGIRFSHLSTREKSGLIQSCKTLRSLQQYMLMEFGL
ncbi:DUF294 nucleotidyltransferase-like domain-containing protein [Virgibacillus sp. W0181]|uniref:DUF294 nucleotidyltransferase-like domain-containing protein n=1 Tax=Virgibacillus sp. W0181 TaxID=3391581 RepID=UPI003F45BF84